eukprot:1179094-Prorocentrum_minimum.AAC.3
MFALLRALPFRPLRRARPQNRDPHTATELTAPNPQGVTHPIRKPLIPPTRARQVFRSRHAEGSDQTTLDGTNSQHICNAPDREELPAEAQGVYPPRPQSSRRPEQRASA